MKMTKLAIAAAISLFSGTLAAAQSQPATTSAPAMPTECIQWMPKPSTINSVKDVKRIFVDSFGEDPVSAQIQSMVVTQLLQSGKFVVTENKSKADAILKGAGVEKTSIESHSYESGTAAGHSSGGFSGGPGYVSGGYSGAAAAINDSSSSSQAVNDARASVRMVNQDGDVIWATSKESKGAKYKGASADVADQVVKQLMRDMEKVSKPAETAAAQ
jgi:curli biogenesis system outer membrane secretion channel CsgG